MSDFFFGNWQSLLRVLIVTPLAYVGLVIFLRISGKRTLAKMNAFDLVVTVALGSTLATGLSSLALLIALQYAVAAAQVYSPLLRRLVKSEPRLLVHRGAILDRAMRDERVARDEIFSAMRDRGLANLEQVEAVVLETDGTFTVLGHAGDGDREALRAVRGT